MTPTISPTSRTSKRSYLAPLRSPEGVGLGRPGQLSATPNPGHQRHAGPVSQVEVGGSVQYHEVGSCPDGEVPDVVSLQCSGTPEGGRPHRLVHRHPHFTRGQRNTPGDAGRVAGTRVAVRRQCNGDAGIEQAAPIRIGRAGRELCPWQQRGYRSAGR